MLNIKPLMNKAADFILDDLGDKCLIFALAEEVRSINDIHNLRIFLLKYEMNDPYFTTKLEITLGADTDEEREMWITLFLVALYRNLYYTIDKQ